MRTGWDPAQRLTVHACGRVLPISRGTPADVGEGEMTRRGHTMAREGLECTFVKNSESERIWLAAVKLEAENGELAVMGELLVCIRTPRVRFAPELYRAGSCLTCTVLF